jgi:hypothetical protein
VESAALTAVALTGFGVKFGVMSLVIAKVPVPDLVESAWLVAVICTVAGEAGPWARCRRRLS